MTTSSQLTEESFQKMKTYWINEIKEYCDDPNPRIMIVGTKSDARKNERVKKLLKN